MNIKGAIFDVDGTLINSLIVWETIWEKLGLKFLSQSGFRPSASDDKKVRTMLLKDAMEMIAQNYGFNAPGSEVLDYTNYIIAEFYKNEVLLKEGVAEFLDYLYKNNVKMCVATASEIFLTQLAMEKCGIKKYFPEIISCAHLGKGKDSPDVFYSALEYLGTPKEQTFVFEDSLVAVKTAKECGFNTVGIYDDNNYGQQEIAKTATFYINKNETLLKLIG